MLLLTQGPVEGPGSWLLTLGLILVAAKAAGILAERWGQPAVLGELLAGVLLSPSVFGLLPTLGTDGFVIFHFLAELGVVLLLFEIGLTTDLKGMFQVGPAALAVAALGVAAPFALGFLFWDRAPHLQVPSTVPLAATAIFVGATLTATSVGITARVLRDLGELASAEARIIVGAAVIDDVFGLVILGVVSAMAGGGIVSAAGILKILVLAILFLVGAVVIGGRIAPRLFALIAKLPGRELVPLAALATCLLLAAFADRAGSALIIGAFAAGIVLARTEQSAHITERVQPVAALFTPVFFVMIGGAVDLRLFDVGRPGMGGVVWIAVALSAIAILGKFIAGWAAPWAKFRRHIVGVGMIPRGEVGLIFADIGRRTGVLGAEVFNALLLMVLLTTFLAPVLLKRAYRRSAA